MINFLFGFKTLDLGKELSSFVCVYYNMVKDYIWSSWLGQCFVYCKHSVIHSFIQQMLLSATYAPESKQDN
jgi:hypothetical protein